MINNNLPNNWKAVDFGDIFNFETKSKHKASEGKKNGKYMYFTSSNSQSKSADFFDFDGEYLIFGTGGNASIHCPNGRFSTSGDCLVAKIKNTKVLTKYVYRYLTANMYLLESGFKGAGLKHISKTYIQNIKIPYPKNVEVQKKIAAILEKAERLKEWRKEADRLTDEFLKSTFLKMFGDAHMNPKGWEIVELNKCIEFITSGSRGWSKYYSNKGERFIRIQNVKNGRLDYTDVQFVLPPKTKESIRTKVKEGDLLLSITADLGRTAVVDKKTAVGGAYINQHLALIRLNKKIVNPIFISEFLGEEGGKRQFASLDQIGVKSGLNFNSVKSLKVHLPPLELQNRFANIVKQVEHLREHQSQSKQNIDDLFNALMQKAFKGELAC